jgi:hypothetical protein
MSEIDNYFLSREEPVKSCLLYLRQFILKQNTDITEVWRYRMPFYCYKEKRFCYLWVHKKLHQPYIGIVEGKKVNHPDLITENRSRMKILLIDPQQDIPIKKITAILAEAIRHSGKSFLR